MAKVKDLTGLKFGDLIVLERDFGYVKEHNIKYNRPYWKCQCSCGEIFTVVGSDLTSNNRICCKKCSNKKRINDLTSKSFNNLTVINFAGTAQDGHSLWKCICKCGNEIIVRGIDLLTGHTKSCGCLKHKKAIDHLEGQKFGKLLVLKNVPAPIEIKYKSSYWLCKCDCGQEKIISGAYLKQGLTKSCGCLSSVGEMRIKQLLDKNGIKYEQQKTFTNCRFETGYLAKFDFFINDQFLLEFDGEQHYDYHQTGWNTEINYKQIKIRDEYKNEWCKNNNIILKRIPYWKRDTLTIDDIMGDKFICVDKKEEKKNV